MDHFKAARTAMDTAARAFQSRSDVTLMNPATTYWQNAALVEAILAAVGVMDSLAKSFDALGEDFYGGSGSYRPVEDVQLPG